MLVSEVAALLVNVARSLVDKEDSVSVTVRDSGTSYTLILRVLPEDVGKVIGKKGRMARSLRAILGKVKLADGRKSILLDISASEPPRE